MQAGDDDGFPFQHRPVADFGHCFRRLHAQLEQQQFPDARALGKFGLGRAGTERRHADAGVLQLIGQRLGQRQHIGLEGKVAGHVRPRLERRGGRHIQDSAPAARHHAGQQQAGQLRQRHYIQLQESEFLLGRVFVVFAVEAETGVVDQNINGQTGLIQRFDQGWRRAGLAQIAGEDLGANAVLLVQFVGQPLKMPANASQHKAMSWAYAEQLEATLRAEVQRLLQQAEAAAGPGSPDLDLPAELKRREDRLQKITEVKAEIERRARVRLAQEQAEYEAKQIERAAKEQARGRKLGGKKPQEPTPGPQPKDQVNFTDEDSRIMPVSGGGFAQAYNAQATVTMGSLLIVGTPVTQHPNDQQEMEPSRSWLRATRTRSWPSLASSLANSTPSPAESLVTNAVRQVMFFSCLKHPAAPLTPTRWSPAACRRCRTPPGKCRAPR